MKRRISAAFLGLALVISSAPAALAQTSPYALSPLVDGSLVAAGAASYGASLWLKSIKPKPAAQTPNPSAIPFPTSYLPSSPSLN